ncbi:hypothetical protein IWX46DRAFT_353635 [Phyllosticta citricarpa]|uniref:Secreted protein n=1 Tax=Phyllosticta citricarpa TaxID=55181 RepID=A0ABR1LDF0_9PEZI
MSRARDVWKRSVVRRVVWVQLAVGAGIPFPGEPVLARWAPQGRHGFPHDNYPATTPVPSRNPESGPCQFSAKEFIVVVRSEHGVLGVVSFLASATCMRTSGQALGYQYVLSVLPSQCHVSMLTVNLSLSLKAFIGLFLCHESNATHAT